MLWLRPPSSSLRSLGNSLQRQRGSDTAARYRRQRGYSGFLRSRGYRGPRESPSYWFNHDFGESTRSWRLAGQFKSATSATSTHHLPPPRVDSGRYPGSLRLLAGRWLAICRRRERREKGTLASKPALFYSWLEELYIHSSTGRRHSQRKRLSLLLYMRHVLAHRSVEQNKTKPYFKRLCLLL